MLSNKQIHTLLLENKGDLKAFQKFVGFKSLNAMKFRLESDEPKNNLFGKYVEFLVKNKKADTLIKAMDICVENLGISSLLRITDLG